MLEFLQSYGVWILLGGAFLFLMTRGGGCGIGHSQHRDHQGQDSEKRYQPSAGQSRLDDAGRRSIADEAEPDDVKTYAATHSAGRH